MTKDPRRFKLIMTVETRLKRSLISQGIATTLCCITSEFGRMAKNYGFLVCIIVMVLDVAAGILGIQAEIAQNKVKDLKMWVLECRDPSYQAFKLGLAAAILLALAHAIAHLFGRCICIWSREEYRRATANKRLAVAFLFFSWVVLGVAFSMLIIGTLANSRSTESCGISNHRFLSSGGILCFIHGLFTVAYYVSVTATRREEKRQGNPTVGLT